MIHSVFCKVEIPVQRQMYFSYTPNQSISSVHCLVEKTVKDLKINHALQSLLDQLKYFKFFSLVSIRYIIKKKNWSSPRTKL